MGLSYAEVSLENSFTKHHMDVRALVMDLVLHPDKQTLTVNPASPYVPTALAK